MRRESLQLPEEVTFLERGWLSSNNIILRGVGSAVLIDSGYCTHAGQTELLVRRSIGDLPLVQLLNTHLHSDHCGGNAALQSVYPELRTLIPPGLAHHVRDWDPVALTYVPTGQECPRFSISGTLRPGTLIELAGRPWEIHAAPGHDSHSVILFQREWRLLISADALWENGFGVVFPELDGEHAFAAVAATLDVIESLDPRLIIPGHGPVFSDLHTALAISRRRLAGFAESPIKHAKHAAKVLVKFKLLEVQRWPIATALRWAVETPYFVQVHDKWFSNRLLTDWATEIFEELVISGALARDGNDILNV